MNRFAFLVSVLLLCNIFGATESKGQSYGLGFVSHEVEPEKRTSLQLFPGKGFQVSGNFKISFDLAFLIHKSDYFGNVFQVETGQKNISIVYNKGSFMTDETDPFHFKLINGEEPPKIGFNIDPYRLQNKWNRISLEFDFTHNRVILLVNNIKYIENNVQLSAKGIYKFIWGITYKNTDCPPMKIRNIELENFDKTKYLWPLNEIRGDVVHEVNHNQNATVSNPFWIRATYRSWSFQKTLVVKGDASVAFNENTADLYIVGSDSLVTHNVNTDKTIGFPYPSGPIKLPMSNQTIYNNYNHKLYNYYIDREKQQINTYDFGKKEWDRKYTFSNIIVDYQNAQNFFSAADTSLYVVGGYGHYIYKNTINRYNLNSGKWSVVKPSGNYFWPRCFAAVGSIDSGRTVYFLGGYGNSTGQQILALKNLFDLERFDVKTKTFTKLYDLKVDGPGFVFANSMTIDPKSKDLYALTFRNYHSNTALRLLKGSLDTSAYQFVGDSILYKFYDVKTAAALYYIKETKQFVAVTSNHSDKINQTTFNIYTLSGPPDTTPEFLNVTSAATNRALLIWVALFVLGGTVIFIVYLKKAKRPTVGSLTSHPAVLVSTSAMQNISVPVFEAASGPEPKNALFLFGSMQLITNEGNELIKQFTSLIKELFLIILIHSLKSSRGISNEKLIELLWPDKSELSAKNNGYANLSRLKSLLQQVENMSLSKDSGNWKIEIDYTKMYMDYHYYLAIVANKKAINKEKILQLMEITQRGSFLSGFEYPWLDQMKSEISNDIIDIYLEYIEQGRIDEDPEFLIKVANNIFYLDSVNEEAMIIKCKALSHLGKHSLAKSTFENFIKEFRGLYGEEFKKDFHAVLE
jgi:two-component SAPR family response regulator